MTSEIRVNKIENRSGLGTVTFADTGVDLAGIVTATTFSGSGASLTGLPAAQLSGTLPALSAANLTNVPAANITGTLPALSAANLTSIPAANVTGTLPALTAANLTNIPAANLVGVATGGFKRSGETSLQVLEQFYSPCDGSTIATSGGNITLSNITARQQCTTSFATLTGSSISYVPPSGTTQVIYTFQFVVASDGDSNGLLYAGFTVDGNEATDARFTERLSSNYWDTIVTFTWGINIGGSTTAATGRLASWTSAKTLVLDVKEHGSDNESQLHYIQNWGTGYDPIVRKPCIGITAIGTLS